MKRPASQYYLVWIRARMYEPGEPEKRARAGMTVLGGIMVLSAILAQSFMMVNLPCKIVIALGSTECKFTTHDDTVLADLDVISDCGCLDNRVGSDVDIVSDLHRIVVEISAVSFIWWSEYSMSMGVANGPERKKDETS